MKRETISLCSTFHKIYPVSFKLCSLSQATRISFAPFQALSLPSVVPYFDELRTTLHAELIPLLSGPGVCAFVTMSCGNFRVDYITTIRAMPHWGIDSPVIEIEASIYHHPTVYLSFFSLRSRLLRVKQRTNKIRREGRGIIHLKERRSNVHPAVAVVCWQTRTVIFSIRHGFARAQTSGR